MDFKTFSRCLLVILIGSILAAGPAIAADTIKIGVVGPRTGGAAATGKAFEEGIQLATAYVNAQGGVLGKNLEIVFEDTAGAPDKAASGFERLVTRDKVVMVLGESHSSAALAEIEVAKRLKVPFIVVEAWADPITAKNYKYVFRAGPSNSGVVGNTIAQWVGYQQFKKAYIVAENTDWGAGHRQTLRGRTRKSRRGFPYPDHRTKEPGPLHGAQQDQGL